MKGETLQTRLSRFLLSYRITAHAMMGLSPAELMLSGRLRSALDLLMPCVKIKVQQKQLKQKETHDTNRILRNFFSGDNIFIRNYYYSPKGIPAVIQSISGSVSYIVIVGRGQTMKWQVDQVRARLTDTVFELEPESDLVFLSRH